MTNTNVVQTPTIDIKRVNETISKAKEINRLGGTNCFGCSWDERIKILGKFVELGIITAREQDLIECVDPESGVMGWLKRIVLEWLERELVASGCNSEMVTRRLGIGNRKREFRITDHCFYEMNFDDLKSELIKEHNPVSN